MAKFPNRLYVKRELSDSTEYFVSTEEPTELVQTGECIKVAEYRLVGTRKARGCVQFSKRKA